jgi:hypothetical protein
MQKSAFQLFVLAGILGCTAPPRTQAPASGDHDSVRQDLAQMKESLNHLENRLGHLESEVSASSEENELTEMTIDSVTWSDPRLGPEAVGKEPVLLCHVKEWRGFGKMLRFTRRADRTFVLEVDGKPRVDAWMSTGGISSSDGSLRYVTLTLGGDLDPNATYRLRPHNENDKYHWSVPADLVVVAPARGR